MVPALLFSFSKCKRNWNHFSYSILLCNRNFKFIPRQRTSVISFYELALGMNTGGLPIKNTPAFPAGIPEILLTAISLGAVFFGAMTISGNGSTLWWKQLQMKMNQNANFFGYTLGNWLSLSYCPFISLPNWYSYTKISRWSIVDSQ